MTPDKPTPEQALQFFAEREPYPDEDYVAMMSALIAIEAERTALRAQLKEYSGWSPGQFLGLLAEHRALQRKHVELDSRRFELQAQLDEARTALEQAQMYLFGTPNLGGLQSTVTAIEQVLSKLTDSKESQ